MCQICCKRVLSPNMLHALTQVPPPKKKTDQFKKKTTSAVLSQPVVINAWGTISGFLSWFSRFLKYLHWKLWSWGVFGATTHANQRYLSLRGKGVRLSEWFMIWTSIFAAKWTKSVTSGQPRISVIRCITGMHIAKHAGWQTASPASMWTQVWPSGFPEP